MQANCKQEYINICLQFAGILVLSLDNALYYQ